MQQKEFNRWSLFLFLYCNQDSRFIYFAAYKVPVWVSRQPSPRSNYSASPHVKLMTSQSLPPSSASSVIIMSHSIDFAGLARRKNSLTLHCSLTWNSNQNDKFSPPYPPGFHTKQVSHTPTDRSEPELSVDTYQDSKPRGFLFQATLPWKLSGHLLAKSHRYIWLCNFPWVKIN